MSTGAPALITGALGFVGRHMVEDLLAANQPVVGVGRHGPAMPVPETVGPFRCVGPATELPAGLRFTGDAGSFLYRPLALEDAEDTARVLDQVQPGTVYHLAAQSSAAVSFREPADTFASNLMGTLNLLEAVRELAEAPVVVSVGSCEEYGPQPLNGAPLGEDTSLNPISPYAVSKVAQTLLCRQYALSWDLPIVVARAFSHTGPGQDPRFAFPSFARQVAATEATGGGEILTGDLSAVRDFLDVRDVVHAYRLLAARGQRGEIYNVCSGSPLTIRRGLDILLADARHPVTVRMDPSRCRPSDTPHLVGDGAKLRDATGWAPEHDFTMTLLGLLQAARKELS